MAKTKLSGNGVLWPYWPANVQHSAQPLVSNATVAAAAAAKLFAIGAVEWADGGTHDIDKVIFRGTATSPSYTLRISLQDVDTAAGPVGRSDGVVDQYGEIVNPSTGAPVHTVTLDADRTSVASGTLLAVVFDYSAYVSGSMGIATMNVPSNSSPHRPLVSSFDGTATYAIVGTIPAITFEAADGTFGQFAGAYPAVSGVTNVTAFGSGSTPDEVAVEFTVPGTVWCGGARVLINAAASADYDIVLYNGTTPIASHSVITDTTVADATPRWVEARWADVQLDPGATYRLAIKPTTANLVTLYYLDVSVAGHLNAFSGTMAYTTRTDAGAFAAPTTTRQLFASLKITAFNTGGGGSPLASPFI
jgi:hypothetical protein